MKAPKDFDSDCYETPPWLFEYLNDKFNLIIDACSSPDNMLCKYRFDDASQDWCHALLLDKHDNKASFKPKPNQSIFMNPPYSNPAPFIKRAWEFSQYIPVVSLVRDGILTCRYMDFLDKRNGRGIIRDWEEQLKIYSLSKRVDFYFNGIERKGVPFSVCLLVMDRR